MGEVHSHNPERYAILAKMKAYFLMGSTTSLFAQLRDDSNFSDGRTTGQLICCIFVLTMNPRAEVGECWNSTWNQTLVEVLLDQRVEEFMSVQQSLVQASEYGGQECNTEHAIMTGSPVVKKVERRLEGWQTKMMSRGGNWCYFSQSCRRYLYFKVPVGVKKQLEGLMRRFLWKDTRLGQSRCIALQWFHGISSVDLLSRGFWGSYTYKV